MNANLNIMEALGQIAREKNVDPEMVIETLSDALVSAARKRYGNADNFEVQIDPDSGHMTVLARKTVVEEVEDPDCEILVAEAREMDPGVMIGDELGMKMEMEVDEATGQDSMVVIEHKEDLHPQIIIEDSKKQVVANYPIPAGAHVQVGDNDTIQAGTLLAKTPRKTAKTKDITGGLPRVSELFEARQPKDAAEIARIDGMVDFGAIVRGKRTVIVQDQTTAEEEQHMIPIGKHVIVFKGDLVKKGQQLPEGPMVPHDILEVRAGEAIGLRRDPVEIDVLAQRHLLRLDAQDTPAPLLIGHTDIAQLVEPPRP